MLLIEDEQFDKTVKIARTYLATHENTMPPMLVGFNAAGESIVLVGMFRDFQEQLTFCTIARMAFILYGVTEYHILTHSDFQYQDETPVSKLEVIMAAAVTLGERRGKIFRIERNDTGAIANTFEEMEFDADSGGIEGMFMNLLPPKEAVLPDNLQAGIEQVVAQIRYIPPVIEEEEEKEATGVSKLFQQWKVAPEVIEAEAV